LRKTVVKKKRDSNPRRMCDGRGNRGNLCFPWGVKIPKKGWSILGVNPSAKQKIERRGVCKRFVWEGSESSPFSEELKDGEEERTRK